MADMEDSLSPTWENIMTSHKNLVLTCNKKINYFDGEAKKMYKLKRSSPVSIFFRIRSLHKVEAHIDIGGQPMSATLFDLGVYLFHNAVTLAKQ
jgi:malate synthase